MYQVVTKALSPPFQSTLFHPTSHLKTDRKRTSAEVRFVVAPASEGVARTTGGNYGTHIYDPLWVGQNDLNININPRKGCPTHKGSWVLVALFTPIHRLYEPRMGAIYDHHQIYMVKKCYFDLCSFCVIIRIEFGPSRGDCKGNRK